MTKLSDAVNRITEFKDGDLTEKIFMLEESLTHADIKKATDVGMTNKINFDLFKAADIIKSASSQIDTIIHTIGIITLLPIILSNGEHIDSISLGAGSTGKRFDLSTNLKIAEFEFSNWKGNDSARQTSFFEDYYQLAEEDTNKMKILYILDKELPEKFLNSKRKISVVLNRKTKIEAFQRKVRSKFTFVKEYYFDRNDRVNLVSIIELLRENSNKL